MDFDIFGRGVFLFSLVKFVLFLDHLLVRWSAPCFLAWSGDAFVFLDDAFHCCLYVVELL